MGLRKRPIGLCRPDRLAHAGYSNSCSRARGEGVIFVWRGWGPVALVAAFLPLASCGGLMDWNPDVAFLCFGLSTVAGGLACRYLGLKWNQGSGFHMMYWIPLEIWGWIYIALGGLFGGIAGVVLVKKAIGW
jgi:hypothetical protein